MMWRVILWCGVMGNLVVRSVDNGVWWVDNGVVWWCGRYGCVVLCCSRWCGGVVGMVVWCYVVVGGGSIELRHTKCCKI